jgi:hypothetical protein
MQLGAGANTTVTCGFSGGFDAKGIDISSTGGNDNWTIAGAGIIAGPVVLNGGTGASQSFSIIGVSGFDLRVLGGVKVLGGSTTTNAFIVQDVIFLGAVNYQASLGGVDNVSIQRGTFLGATNLKLGDGNNNVSIDNSFFGGALSITAGSGTDVFQFDTLNIAGVTRFTKNVSILAGAGADALTVDGVGVNRTAIFDAALVFDGQDGADTFTDGGATFNGPLPTLLNVP